MEKLSKEQQEGIKKASTPRLCFLLRRVGVEEAVLEAMDRPELAELWARMILEGKDRAAEAAAVVERKVMYDVELEKERLAFERERFEREMQMKVDEEKRKSMELELQREKLDWEKEKMVIESRLAEEKMITERAQLDLNARKENDGATRLKKYADAMKNVLLRQPSESIEIVSFFKNAERIFEEFKVPRDL